MQSPETTATPGQPTVAAMRLTDFQPAQLPTETDVVIVGAGLAGLSAAWELSRAHIPSLLLEAADRPGGRVATDLVDGFRLDRGFQLLNPSYPRIRRLDEQGAISLQRLQLQPFDAGVRIALNGRQAILADPRRSPKDLLATLTAPIGSPKVKLAAARWALRCSLLPAARLIRQPDRPYRDALDGYGITGPLAVGVVQPFLAGVLGEDDQSTSTRFVELIMRSFVRGTPAVPAWGMGELPAQLAAALPDGTLWTGITVGRIDPARSTVHTSHGEVTARKIIIATDTHAAASLTGLPAAATRSLTTVWFCADETPFGRPILHVDGLRRGPIVNAAVLSAAAPAYSPDGRALIACTAVGSQFDHERLGDIRKHAGVIFSRPTDRWQVLRVDAIEHALPAMTAPLMLDRPTESVLSEFGYLAGDYRESASQQGALASGARAARAAIRAIRT